MDDQKSARGRNWRSFLKEFAIIVLGVSVALAAQQAADWLHWQGEVKAARVTLAAEFVQNDTAFARRIAYAPCIDRQLDEADAILVALQARKPPGRFTNFHPGTGSPISDSEWQSQRSAQTLTHFPREELALMSRYYAQLPRFLEWWSAETAAHQELRILQDLPAGLDLATLMRIRVNLGIAREIQRIVVLNAGRQLRLSRQLGHARVTADPERVKAFCTLSEQSWGQYLQSLEPRDNP